MRNIDFCEKLRALAAKKTIYAKGGYGAYSSEQNIDFLKRLYPEWYHADRIKMLSGSGAYMFDCVCMIKSVVNGWTGDISHTFGGSKPGLVLADIGTEAIMKSPHTTHQSDNFRDLKPGSILHKPGHVGVYVGRGEVVECCWDRDGGGVRISKFDGKWDSHARLACINYDESVDNPVENVQIPCTWDPVKKTLTISLDSIV